jgi:hypothetical protein
MGKKPGPGRERYQRMSSGEKHKNRNKKMEAMCKTNERLRQKNLKVKRVK